MKIGAGKSVHRARWQGFRTKAGVGQYSKALRELANGGGSKLVGVRHGTGSIVGDQQIATRQSGLSGFMARLTHRDCDSVLQFCQGVRGEGVAEVLNDVETISAANHTHTYDVVSRVEQIRSVRRGEHQVFVALLRTIVESDILGFLVELQVRHGGQALRQGGLVFEPVRELPGIEHSLCMNARGLGKTIIQGERRRSGEMPRLVCEDEESLLGIGFVGIEWNVAGRGRRRPERGILTGLACRRSSQG